MGEHSSGGGGGGVSYLYESGEHMFWGAQPASEEGGAAAGYQYLGEEESGATTAARVEPSPPLAVVDWYESGQYAEAVAAENAHLIAQLDVRAPDKRCMPPVWMR